MENNVERGKKRKAIDESPTLNLKVKAQDGRYWHFRIRVNDPLYKLMRTYCEKRQLDFRSIKFFYNGSYINPRDTANSLRLEDGEEIDAMYEQFGGGGGLRNFWLPIYKA